MIRLNKFKDKEQYVIEKINYPKEYRLCRYYDEDIQKMIYTPFNSFEDKDQDRIIMLPVGLKDEEGNAIYVGDYLLVEISTKYGAMERVGIVRMEGLYMCGIDYLDKVGNVTEDGDFIDEPYLNLVKVLGNVIEGFYSETCMC